MRRNPFLVTLAVGLAPILFGAQEDKSTEHKTFSNVRELIVDNINGFIEVTGTSGNTVDAEITKTLTADSQDRLALARKDVRLDIAQEGGLVRLMVDGPFRNHGDMGYHAIYDFKLRVPRDVKLDLRSINRSHITLEGTAGDFKIHGVSTEIEMRDIEGSGSVQTVNGPIKVGFARSPKEASSFKTVNGRVEVAFPSDLNANVHMKTVNGGLFTDFAETELPPAGVSTGMHKVIWRTRGRSNARIGGGGPELDFETVNGDVLIKNRGK